MEWMYKWRTYKHLKSNKTSQHGFFKNKLYQARLTSFLDRITAILIKMKKKKCHILSTVRLLIFFHIKFPLENEGNVVYMKKTIKMVCDCLKSSSQRIVISTKWGFSFKLVPSEIPGPTLFIIFTKNMHYKVNG